MIPSPPPIARARSILEYFGRYRREFLLGFSALVITNLLALSIPWLLKQAVDALQGVALDRVEVATQFAIFMALAAVLMAVSRSVSRMLIFNGGRKVEHDLRAELFDHLTLLPPSHFQKMSVGDVMSRAVNDLGQVRLVLGPGVLNMINSAVAYTVGLGLMVSIDPWLTLAALAPYPLLLLLVRMFINRLFRQSRKVQETLGELSTFIQEDLAGQQVVQSYSLQPEMVKRFEVHNKGLLESSLQLAFTRGGMIPIFGLIAGVGTLVVLWVGGSRVIEGKLTLGELVAFNGMLAHLTWPTIALGWMLSIWQRGRSGMQRLNEIFCAEPSIRDLNPTPLQVIRGELEAKHLSFQYPTASEASLKDLSFKLKAGGRLGIVGPTGAGKSTFVELLPRLRELGAGSLFLDGVDVCDLPLAQLRGAVGYAPQEPFLFSDTLHANIAFAKPEASREEVEEAARIAAIHADILSFPRGYETMVGERGVTLSGGQRQRVALARAILKRPSLLVLDDSLSSVDADTEGKILAALGGLLQDRSSVVVSHRLVAVKDADLILVLEGGGLAASGTHDELLAQGGYYSEMWRRQRLESEMNDLGGSRSEEVSHGA